MKKTILILLIFALIICLSSCTDTKKDSQPDNNVSIQITEEPAKKGFQPRNGITFDDTIAEVKQKETLTPSETNGQYPALLNYNGTIDGMSVTVEYIFDGKAGKLIDIYYGFGNNNSRESADSDYEAQKSILVQNYGSPLGNKGGKTYKVTGSAFDAASRSSSMMKMIGGDGGLQQYDEWIIEENGYKVKVDLVCAYRRDSKANYVYSIFLSYHYFTD